MTLEVLDDDILDMTGQIAPPCAGRPKLFTAIEPAADSATCPSESYWIGVSRERLREIVAGRQPIMKKSKFGRVPSPFLAEKA